MFKDRLDELLGVEKKAVEVHAPPDEDCTSTAPVELEEELDPPRADKDPFSSMLDEVFADAGVDLEKESRRKYDPSSGNLRAHDWCSERESIFSSDKYKFRCRRCFKWVTVEREQTIDDAMKQQDVNPDCAMAVITDTMEM